MWTQQGVLQSHSGELYYIFGNILREGLPFRDNFDLFMNSMWLILGSALHEL
jgi:hypothetical protein